MANMDRDPGLEIALTAVGGVRALARMIGRSSSTVAVWHTIPVRHVLKLEGLTQIPRYELRPDVYPPPPIRARRA